MFVRSPTSVSYSTPRIDSNQMLDEGVLLPIEIANFTILDSISSPPTVRSTGNNIRYLTGSFRIDQAVNPGDLLTSWPRKEFIPKAFVPGEVILMVGAGFAGPPLPLFFTFEPDGIHIQQSLNSGNIIHFNGLTYISNRQ